MKERLLSWTQKTQVRVLLGIVLLGALLRGWAVLRLPLDFDEPTYLQAGFDYAAALRAGDWNGVIDYAGNREHPALVKLLYGVTILALGPDADPTIALIVNRLVSAGCGVLAVLVLALCDPLAGALLAGHTLSIKYTSQVYLEALPHLVSLIAVLALYQSRAARDRWFWLSAVALGVTAAAKFAYLPIILVILYLARWEKRTPWRDLLLYVILAVGVFALLDPTLWHDPLGRLADTLLFHVRYSHSASVEQVGYPWYQPLLWLSTAPAAGWHPQVFFYFALDGLFGVLALAGLYWEWRERRWVVVWLVTGVLFLLVWPTKWPQYTLILAPAVCLAASSTARHCIAWFREQEDYWAWARVIVIVPPRSFWVVAAIVAGVIGVGYTSFTLQLVLGRLGWSHLTAQNTLLPSNTVYAIVAGPGEQMILGTEHGAAIWSPPATTELPASWTVFTTANSDLPGDRVLAIARTGDVVWFGTAAGVAGYDGTAWQVYHAGDMGLAHDKVQALAVDSAGRLWAGAAAGAAAWDGRAWTPFTAASSGLADDYVMAVAVEPAPAGDVVWFGTRAGISRLDTATGAWATSAAEAGVSALLCDSAGVVWAGTLGGGLGRWDGAAWQFYHTGNSGLPLNTVNAIAEIAPGAIWAGVARPAEVGGVVAEFDGQNWRAYTAQDSGYSGAEPLAMARDQQGRWWFGTRTGGIDLYQLRR